MESVICEYYNQERDIYDKDVALTMEQVIQNLKGKQISGELPMQVTKFINIIQNRCKEYVEQKETLSSNQMIKCFEWILTSVKRYSTDPTSRRYLEFVSKCMLKW
jgi:formylmethanofuran dehydrogenase subunit E